VQVKTNFLREGVFDVQNIITIPHAKLLRKLGNITPEQMLDLEQVLLFWLGFDEKTFTMMMSSLCSKLII